MDLKNSRWISGVATVAALLSVIPLFSIVSLSISQSAAATVLYATSFLGFQRLYAFLVDFLLIAIKRRSPA